MKQLGNLAIVCARRSNVLLQMLNGSTTVFVGQGSNRRSITVGCDDDEKISELIQKLNFGEFSEKEVNNDTRN